MDAQAEGEKRTLPLLSRLLALRIGASLGLALFAFSLLLYRSYSDHSVFGIWSYPFFAVVVAAFLALLLDVVQTRDGRWTYRWRDGL